MSLNALLRLQGGLEAAARALIPVSAFIVALNATGIIHRWRDIFTWQGAVAIATALLVKGIHGAATTPTEVMG